MDPGGPERVDEYESDAFQGAHDETESKKDLARKQELEAGTSNVEDTGVISLDNEEPLDKSEPENDSIDALATDGANEKHSAWRKAAIPLVACLCAILSGGILAVSGAILGRFAIALDSPIGSAFYSFLVGTAILMCTFWLGPRPQIKETLQSKYKDLPPWYLWIGGGTLGAFYVISASYIGPKLGFGFFFVVVITGQLIASLVVDHFEFLKATPRKEITVARVLGCLLAIIGATITSIERITTYIDENGGFDPYWILYIVWAFASGAVLPVQVCSLAAFTKRMQTRPWRTTFLSFATGTIVLGITWGIIILATSDPPDYSDTTWWMFVVGSLGVIYVFSATVIPPILGVAVFLVCCMVACEKRGLPAFKSQCSEEEEWSSRQYKLPTRPCYSVCVMAGQIVGSVIIDDLGLFGFDELDTTVLRVIGIVVAYLGAVVVQFGDTLKAHLVVRWRRRNAHLHYT